MFLDKEGVKLLGIGTIVEGGGFNSSNVRDYSGKYRESQIVKPGEFYMALTSLTGNTRPFPGSTSQLPLDFDSIGITTHHVGKVDFNGEQELSEFCKWVFRSKRFRMHCTYMCSGTTVISVKPHDVLRFEVPSKLNKHQKTLIRTMNSLENLERLLVERTMIFTNAMWAMFRDMFIDFSQNREGGEEFVDTLIGDIPHGWSTGFLEDFISRKKNPTKSGSHLKGRHYVPIDQIDSERLALTKWHEWSRASSSLILFDKNDLLFGSMRAYFHKVALAPFDGVTRSTCFVLSSKNPDFLPYCTMLLNSKSTVRYASDSSLGSTMPYAAWEGTLARHRVVSPPEEEILRYSNSCMQMLEGIRNAGLEINRCREMSELLVRELSVSY